MTGRQLYVGLLVLAAGLAAVSAYAAIAPGRIEVTWIEDGQRIQRLSRGTTAIIHGDDAVLEVSYDRTTRRWYCVLAADEDTAAGDGIVPPLKMTWGGASNQIWLEARRVN